ncbi:PDDEXK nuclease domain-containing protein [Adlercreutzia sp. ZJ141]|uniref:PDDEXK nuclease domain-containing protein n=1 Tax=Adlercreutzia sp. ZJ141 TaxID=2709406 RepID=UPI0013EBFAF5|nr:PDDEXK nuclease domain-containing protein [Adlercreutzia sp. ZJ141]
MNRVLNYGDAVSVIKRAILEAQGIAARNVNEVQLKLYYLIGGFISRNTRDGKWGTGAIEAISAQLKKELPGLRGYSPTNLKNMRLFYEAWSYVFNDSQSLVDISSVATDEIKLESFPNDPLSIRQSQLTNCTEEFGIGFFSVSFTGHMTIINQTKDKDARIFYIQEAARNHFSVETLKRAIREDDYHHQGALPNNFLQALTSEEQAFRAVNAFKDEYLLDFINIEELGARDKDVDERLLEQRIVHNIRDFILKFGRDFAFLGNQYRIEAFGEEQFIDLLFFNRELNCLVAIELKTGPFKTSYLGQLNGYLSLLDEFVRKPNENQSVGIVLCKDANKAFVDFVIRDYDKPLGVATYKTSKDMPRDILQELPPIDELRKLLERSE